MHEYAYIVLLFALFVLPRVLQRYRIPMAITSFAMGAVCGLRFDLFERDATIGLLALFGIVSLFLFAGLDVKLHELRSHARILVQHVLIQALTLAATAAALGATLALELRPALLVALALLTPSTGFILDSLDGYGLPDRARFWIKSKAIATELVALAVLFFVLQSTSTLQLVQSSLFLIALIALLPLVFWLFAAFIVPHAPRSEFAFLMMVAVACGVATHQMGVYYLVGAFVVGMAAQRLRDRSPTLASERMLAAVEAFSSLFVPFYFFNAALQLEADDFGWGALGLGVAFLVLGAPLRLATVWLHRRAALRESFRESLLVAVPMIPTLVFTLVIARILRERFAISPEVFGGLIIYTVGNSLLPAFVFRTPLPELEDELLRDAATARKA